MVLLELDRAAVEEVADVLDNLMITATAALVSAAAAAAAGGVVVA